MVQLELTARPGRPRPPAPPGGELKNSIRREVVAVLLTHAHGRAQAMTGEQLAEFVGAQLREGGHPHALAVRTLMRRVQEAVVELIDLGEPIASSSTPPRGYWWAVSAAELEESLRECEQRARMTLRRRRALRWAMAKLRGQMDLERAG
jgi:hypothetical protein